MCDRVVLGVDETFGFQHHAVAHIAKEPSGYRQDKAPESFRILEIREIEIPLKDDQVVFGKRETISVLDERSASPQAYEMNMVRPMQPVWGDSVLRESEDPYSLRGNH